MEKTFEQTNIEGDELLKLSLSTGSPSQSSHPLLGQPTTSPPLQFLSPPPNVYNMPPTTNPPSHHQEDAVGPLRSSRGRKSPPRILRHGKSPTVPAPYPWATNRRATIHSLEYLLDNGLNIISGQVKCKKCEKKFKSEYDLQQKFMEVASFISKNKFTMHDRAPAVWMNPILPDCNSCNQRNCVTPIITKKKSVNWLFLLLGQMLGCCRLKVLKYFCKHTKNHRTGAKDRVLYLTYLGLCKQLEPKGPFDV